MKKHYILSKHSSFPSFNYPITNSTKKNSHMNIFWLRSDFTFIIRKYRETTALMFQLENETCVRCRGKKKMREEGNKKYLAQSLNITSVLLHCIMAHPTEAQYSYKSNLGAQRRKKEKKDNKIIKTQERFCPRETQNLNFMPLNVAPRGYLSTTWNRFLFFLYLENHFLVFSWN